MDIFTASLESHSVATYTQTFGQLNIYHTPGYLYDGCVYILLLGNNALIVRFMGPTWGQFGAQMTQMGAMLAP